MAQIVVIMGHTFEELSSQILGAAVEVHRTLGPGFLEGTYARALEIALSRRGLAFHRELVVPVRFGDDLVGHYRLDLVVGDVIIVELKAVKRFEDVHFAQLRAYLRASGLPVGLLLNFNTAVLTVRRVVV